MTASDLPHGLGTPAQGLAEALQKHGYGLPSTDPKKLVFWALDCEYHSNADGQRVPYSVTIWSISPDDSISRTRCLYRQWIQETSSRPLVSRPGALRNAVPLGQVHADVKKMHDHHTAQGLGVVWLHWGGTDLADLGICPASTGLVADLSTFPMFGSKGNTKKLANAVAEVFGWDAEVCNFEVQNDFSSKPHSDHLDGWGTKQLAKFAGRVSAYVTQLLKCLRRHVLLRKNGAR